MMEEEQLKELSATDQADTTFSGDTKVPKERQIIPQTRFEGQGGSGTSSAVDLSNKVNEDQMWKEYNAWRDIGKSPNPRMNLLKTGSIWENNDALTEQREKAKYAWYLKYYGMNPDDYEALKNKRKEKYEGLAGLDNTFRNLTDISMGSTTDFAMDAIGVLPGLGALDNYYDRRTKSRSGFMQGLSLIHISEPTRPY